MTTSRLAFAAAHVVMRDGYRACAHAPDRPGAPEEIAAHVDWDATLKFRRHLASHGFGIAEAMDTAQRFELGWASARRLIEETGRLGLPTGFVAGAGTDHLDAVRAPNDLVAGVTEQCGLIAAAGGIPVILPMPWLARSGADADADTYVDVYRRIIEGADGPLFVHWLGAMFMPELEGYFPGDSFDRVMNLDPAKVRGAKLSLLDEAQEVAVRRRLLEHGQILLTGDDFHFPPLIEGTDPAVRDRTRIGPHDVALGDFSHALLGILGGIAVPAAKALGHLDRGDVNAYRAIMDPCAALARIIFEPPTEAYKVGLAFLAWINGHQTNPMLVNHAERGRPREHLERLLAAAETAGALADGPATADRVERWRGIAPA